MSSPIPLPFCGIDNNHDADDDDGVKCNSEEDDDHHHGGGNGDRDEFLDDGGQDCFDVNNTLEQVINMIFFNLSLCSGNAM